jgi:ABC-type enterochelin transport system ATPase subunit
MAWAQDTEYLLLDEPLNNLDIAASRSLMARLKTLAQQEQRTIVIVLHDINYAAGYADHIVALKAGQIVAAGPPQEIVSEDFCARFLKPMPRWFLPDKGRLWWCNGTYCASLMLQWPPK